MELKQNPFSLYDFLGYFTPGAIFFYGCMAIFAHTQPNTKVLDFITFDRNEIYIPFVLLSYTAGHLLSFISSIFVEKYSEWTIGYPSKYLLGFKAEGYFSGNIFVRLLVALLLAPISIFELLLNVTIKYRNTYAKPLDVLLQNIIRSKGNALIKDHSGQNEPPEGYSAATANFFLFFYHYVVENSPNHFAKMQNYVALYGFLRTLTFISVLFFWSLIFHVVDGYFSIKLGGLLLLVSSTLSMVFYLAFVKFHRRFSLEVLMALTAIYEIGNTRKSK